MQCDSDLQEWTRKVLLDVFLWSESWRCIIVIEDMVSGFEFGGSDHSISFQISLFGQK